MKKIIKKLLRESLLNEKVMDVNDDVDFIYDTYFKNDIDEINKTGFIRRDMFKRYNTNTDILSNELSLKVNEINPCKIQINHGNNFYNPFEQLLSMSINFDAIKFALEYNGDINKAKKGLTINMGKSFIKEFSEEKIKGTIHHELVHWIDDTIHNQHIKKHLSKSKKTKYINAHHLELQAQIHNIIQLKRKHEDLWDLLSFDELISMSPTLSLVYRQLPIEERNIWIKKLKRRMYREGLLGQEMYN